jgi:aspartate/methionine/tyrosine aminotransferase
LRFSKRIPGAFEPNRIHLAIEAKRRSGARLIDLTETNPTRVGLPAPETWASLAEGAREPYVPSATGSVTARKAVARYYADRGLAVSAEQIVLTASTSEAYAHLFRMLADPGDEILVPEPSYPLFGPLAALESVELVPYPLRYRDGRWRVDLDELRVGPRSRAIIVVHPNNPTGSLTDEDEAQALESHGLPLIADEVFGDFAFPAGPRRVSFAAAERGLAFVLAGLSKTCGLPQAKLAWIVCAGAPRQVARAREGLEWMTVAFLSVSSAIQGAAPALLAARAPFIEATRARLQTNLAALDAAGLDRLSWEGGWSAVVRAPAGRNDEEWTLAALERDVLVQPGHFYDFEDESHLVVSLLPEPSVFAEGARRLEDSLAG